MRIAILGSTGSIGRQTLDICGEYPDKIKVAALTANTSVGLLAEQALRWKPRVAVIADPSHYRELKEALAGSGVEALCGNDAIADIAAADYVDRVVTAMVGYSGLAPTINAIKAGKDIALANKETLVVAGELITSLCKEYGSVLYPIDSEHGAIYQCLVGEEKSTINKLILTASGGPFRTWSREQISQATAVDALRHPKWKMGAKITIDSATMMNKGFEIMEARWLFGVEANRIEVAVHPQSIVHSMVEFTDGSVKAQLGLPDMHLPIRYALGMPQGRLATNSPKMKIEDYSLLTFERPDENKFPMLTLARNAMASGGNAPCALNAANEVAVAAYLRGRTSFYGINAICSKVLELTHFTAAPTYDELVATDAEARKRAEELL